MNKYPAWALLLPLLAFDTDAAEMPLPDAQWRIAGLDFGVRHMVEKSALCSSNQVDTYSMASVPTDQLGTVYRGVSSRLRLLCRIDSDQKLHIPVKYSVGGDLVATFTVVDDPRNTPFPQLVDIKMVAEPKRVSPLFQSYWDNYGSTDFALSRKSGEQLPDWAQSDYLYALAVDRQMFRVGVYDVYFDSRFEAGPLDIVDPAMFEAAIESGHPLALIMSMLDYFPYAGADAYNIEQFWQQALEDGVDKQRLQSDVQRLVDAGFLQGDILSGFLTGNAFVRAGDAQAAQGSMVASRSGKSTTKSLNEELAYRSIQDYFRSTDCDAFPRLFFNDPDNDSPKKVAMAAVAYSFVAGGCGVGVRGAEIVMRVTRVELPDCSIQPGRNRCDVILQYECDANGFMRGTAQARLACAAYTPLMVDASSIWEFTVEQDAQRWNADFVGK